MLRGDGVPEITRGATTTWWIEADEVEVTGSDRAAWEEAVASFNRAHANRHSQSMFSPVAGHLETLQTAIVDSTVDVVDLAELRRRRQ